MIKKRRFPKIFFGWWTVLVSSILSLWGSGYYHYGFSALFKPIASELGFSRAVTSVPAAIGRFEGGIEGPISGWATDKFGPRWIVLFGVFMVSLGLIMMNFIQSLWAFYVAWGFILGTGINVALSIPLDTAITNWFVKKRGLALSIRWVFSGLSGVLILPLIALLIYTQGWRMTCLIGGVVMVLVGLPLAWFCLKRYRPEYYGMLPDGATVKGEVGDTKRTIDRGVKYAAEVEEAEFTLRQAIRTPALWLIVTAHGIHAMASPAINVHGIPFLTDMGIEPIRAASMIAMMALASVPARFVAGLVVDRSRKNYLRFVIGGAYLLQAIGFGIFVLNQTIPMIYVWFILYGLGHGAALAGFVMVLARYFGRKAFGSIRGLSSLVMTPVGVAAPIYAGWVYDTTDSYIIAFILIGVLVAFAAVLLFMARPPKTPAQVTDVRKIF
ncbi:MFS transporter [Chloroflexota bacterium]